MSVWGARRQLGYFLFIVLLIAAGIGWYLFANRPAKTCFDGELNQNEIGIDCGGVCDAVCESETIDIVSIWARPFKVSDGVYNVAAFVENANIFGLERLDYKFRVEDSEGVLIRDKEGSTFVNPDERFVIIETNIDVGERTPARALIEFTGRSEWVRYREDFTRPVLSVRNKNINTDRAPRASAIIENKSLRDFEDIEVPVVVFDQNQNAIAASRTVVGELLEDEEKEIFFTWPDKFEGEALFVEMFPRINTAREEREY